MEHHGPPDEDALPNREREHVRHRDRKRKTDMVVDNAAVKRIVRALADRRASKKRKGK